MPLNTDRKYAAAENKSKVCDGVKNMRMKIDRSMLQSEKTCGWESIKSALQSEKHTAEKDRKHGAG